MGESEKKSSAKQTGKKSPKKSKQNKKDFLVVGLGASAGGVMALQEFFASMPPNSGMAFVVILHLSPQHESNLPQILQSQTTMPVIQVNETYDVEPNNVYVIPPNSQLEMVDGIIRCLPPEKKVGTRVAIDIFFRTLADAYERKAVCVVLSGTGSDGTLGLKRVKESNGFAVVQTPEDAEYDQMPRSAIATGLADWVLPIRQMPEKLISFRASSDRLHLTDGDAEKVSQEINAEDSLREILTILRVRTGHDFTNYKKPTLIRRIARHLQIHELEDIPTYLNFLRDNPDEIQFLQRNLLINVTNFFRDREAFETLEKDVIPKLFSGKSARDTIRVWTAGCASGEEAYSLAMLLTEHAEKLSDPPKFQIFATDVDDEAINQAREHHYSETIEADVSAERLKRFFTRDGDEYRIKKELRETVLFAPHNILRDPPFSKLDLITCRNLLIYLDREAQERVMEVFHFALRQNGYLFLGTSETAEGSPELFEATDKKYRIYQRRDTTHIYHAPPKLLISGKWQLNAPGAKKTAERIKSFSLGEVHYKLLENFAPPSVLVNQDFDVVYMSESIGRYLQFTGGEPSNNLLKLVNPDLLPDLRAALFTAQRDKQSSEFSQIRVTIGGVETFVKLIVRFVDVDNYSDDFLLVIFDESSETKPASAADTKATKQEMSRARDQQNALTSVVERLEEELRRAKINLRTTIEQHEVSIEELKASNEELQAINEELRSASEELETSKEELQSVNEELTTVNHELKDKIEETTRANSDLQNLIVSTDIATIFLDRSLRIKRYAPLIEKLFNIKSSDIGRPLEHFTHHLNYEGLGEDAELVLKTLKTIEREISDKDGRHFLTRFSPYRTIDDRINGVVLNFIDITDRKETEEKLRRVAEFNTFRIQLLNDVLRPLNDPIQIQMQACRLLGEYLQADRAYCVEINEKEDYARVERDYVRGDSPSLAGSFSLEEFGWIVPQLREGKIVVVDDTQTSKIVSKADRDSMAAIKITAHITAPLVKEGELTGALCVTESAPREWTKSEIELVRETAEFIWVSVERVRAEAARYESEERFRAFVTASSDAVYSMNADWTEMRFLVGKDFIPDTKDPNISWLEKYIHPDDQRQVLRVIREAVKTKKVFELEHRIARVDGTFGWTHSRAIPLLDQNGKITGWFGTASDTTEKNRVEESLRQSEERLRIAIEAANMATWVWDLRKNEVVWNKQHYTLFGLKPRENPQSPDLFFEHIHPEDRNWVGKRLNKAVKTNTTFSAEFRIIREDGETRWMEGYGHVVEIVKNKPVRMSGVMSDITARKRIEIELRESQSRLELLMESVKDFAIMTTDLKGIVIDWNKGAENVFGWTAKEIIGKSSDVIFTPEDIAIGQPEKERQVARTKGRAEDERFHLRKDGSRFYVSGMMTPLKNGELEGYVKVARDQTAKMRGEKDKQEKEMLRRLIAAQEEERRRIARDIHDHFGQQLTALRIKLDALQKKNQNKTLVHDIEEAQEISKRLDADVDFIAWELRPAALDDLGLRVTLQNFVRDWSHHTKVKTEFHTSGLNRSKLSDETEISLYRIAQEALNNIYKHANAKTGSVILEKRKNKIILIIEDTGIGFNVADKDNRQKGIGLTGMEERTKILGGEFEIESKKGKGTTIFIRVPAKLSEAQD